MLKLSLKYAETFTFHQNFVDRIPDNTMHYRARAIKEGRFRFANLASHFICIQIFQIDLPPILSTSKYFR